MATAPVSLQELSTTVSATPSEQVPELQTFRHDETLLARTAIDAHVPAFVFPGLILVIGEAAHYLPAADLPLLEGPARDPGAVAFEFAGLEHSITWTRLGAHAQSLAVRVEEPFGASADLTVLVGSLLRATGGRLYYVPPGRLRSFRSFATASVG